MAIAAMGNAAGWAVTFAIVVIALGWFIWRAGPELRCWVEMCRPAQAQTNTAASRTHAHGSR